MDASPVSLHCCSAFSVCDVRRFELQFQRRDTDAAAPTPATTTPAATCSQCSRQPPAVMTTLPANVLESELKALNGAPIKLSNYDGKVLVVNLWATWCRPCRVKRLN